MMENGRHHACPRPDFCPWPHRPGGDRQLHRTADAAIVRVRREKKGRRGKTVTTITGVPLPAEELLVLAGELKRRCGTGGSAKQGVVEIQGDHVDALVEELGARGYTVKRAGG